jgi:erythritol transport system ATP-binding protein
LAVTGELVLQAEAVSKVYGGTVALDDVDFEVERGRVAVLIGENGAGKTTLMRILAGVEEPTRGRLLLDGRPVRFDSPRAAAAAGIAIIHQELSLFPNLTVAENVFAGREPLRFGLATDRARAERETRAVLERLEQPIDPGARCGALPLGQQQVVEIARALAQEARVLIMDEPTSALSAAETAALFRLIRELRARGTAVVYISHRLEELMEIGDRLTVLRDGRRVAAAARQEASVAWIVEQMLGRSATEAGAHVPPPGAQALLEAEGLSLRDVGGRLLLDDVCLHVAAGEIVGLYGLMGAGRTELVECLAGARRQISGTIRLGGNAIEGLDLPTRLRRGVVLVPEDRQAQALFPSLCVAHNMTLASLRAHVRGLALSPAKERETVGRMAAELAIASAVPDSGIGTLSGGNQQKVVIARALLARPRLLLLDEPTRGIDVGAKADLRTLVRKLARDGVGIVFVSSDLEEVLGVADRIVVLSNGRVSGRFAASEASEGELVSAAALGHGRAGRDAA